MPQTIEDIHRLPPEARVIPYGEFLNTTRKLASQGARTFVIPGVYDILHLGHASFARAARRLAGQNALVVAGVDSDESVGLNRKEGRPVNNQGERAAHLTEYRSVDLVVIFPHRVRYMNPGSFLSRYKELADASTSLVIPVFDPYLPQKCIQAAQTGLNVEVAIYRHVSNSTTRMLQRLGYE